MSFRGKEEIARHMIERQWVKGREVDTCRWIERERSSGRDREGGRK